MTQYTQYINQVEAYILYLFWDGLKVEEISAIMDIDEDLVSTIIVLEAR